MSKSETIFSKAGRALHACARSCSAVFNRLKLKAFGVQYEGTPVIEGKFYLERGEGASITLGRGFHLVSGGGRNRLGRNVRSGLFAAPGASITIGDGTGISCSSIWAREEIVIGNNVNIGADCIVMDHDAHSMDAVRRRDWAMDSADIASRKVEISDDVLLGARCIVLKGVHIGRGSVVGAGSVVTGDIPAGQVWAGNPARFIKELPIR